MGFNTMGCLGGRLFILNFSIFLQFVFLKIFSFRNMSKVCSHFKSGFCFRGDACAFRHDHRDSVRPNPINIFMGTPNIRPPSHIPRSQSSQRTETDQPYSQSGGIRTDFEFSSPRSSCFYSSGGSTHRYKILSLSFNIWNCFFLPSFGGFCNLSGLYRRYKS